MVTKDGFANTLSQYDDFRAGALFDPAELEPFDFTVDDFDVTFIREGREAGMAHKFAADLTYRTAPGAPTSSDKKISVNHPLHIDGTDVFLISHGYAPHITVRNADRTRRLLRAGGVPARGQHLPVLRGGEGARRSAEERPPPRSGSRASSTRRTPSPRPAGRSRPSPTTANPAISMLA